MSCPTKLQFAYKSITMLRYFMDTQTKLLLILNKFNKCLHNQIYKNNYKYLNNKFSYKTLIKFSHF